MPILTSFDGEDPRRAKTFFKRGKVVAETGNFDYAIEMFIEGLSLDPDNVDAHQALRDISLRRSARGGRDMGMFARLKMPKASDGKQAMLNAAQLLAYGPADVDRMIRLLRAANAAGFDATVAWIWKIVDRAQQDERRSD